MTGETRRWFAGVDWGSEKHQVCLLDEAGAVVGERAFRHDGAGLAALCDWLVSLAGGAGHRHQPAAEGRQARSVVPERPLAHDRAGGIEQADLVLL